MFTIWGVQSSTVGDEHKHMKYSSTQQSISQLAVCSHPRFTELAFPGEEGTGLFPGSGGGDRHVGVCTACVSLPK